MGYLPRKRASGAVIARGAMTLPVAPSGDIASGESGTTLTREQIRAFQTKLIDLGFTNEGRVIADGAFGDNTRAAVRAFQTARSLPASGTLDAATRAALDASPGLTLLVPRNGVQSQAEIARVPGIVAFYQQVLQILGANANGRLRVDGALGPNTTTAVTEFQRWWSPENLRRANASPNPDDQARWRAALARTENGRITVDGNLGPDTQRLLLWLAIPRAEGGGGEGEEYAVIAPHGSVRPYTLEIIREDGRAANYRLRSPDAAPVTQNNTTTTPAQQRGRVADAMQEIALAEQDAIRFGDFSRALTTAESVRRHRGRRTVLLSGLNPQVGARIFVGDADVTATAEENGQGARWAGSVWRMGVPDTATTLRVVAPDRAEVSVTLPAPPSVSTPNDNPDVASVASNIAQRTVRVNVPLTGTPTVEQGGVPQVQQPRAEETPPVVTRVAGRRSVLIYGLDPRVATNVFADEVSVTMTPDELGRPAGWDGPVWRMGVPDTARTLRVSSAGRPDFSVSLPAPAAPTADVANSVVQRSVRIDVPAPPPVRAGMGGVVWVGAAAAILAGIYFSTQRSGGGKR